jgi:hypothetical protein
LLVDVENLQLPFLSLGKLIKNKLATGREKDELDAKILIKKNQSLSR